MHVGQCESECESACMSVSARVHACWWARSADPADVFDVGESHDLEVHMCVRRDGVGMD